MKYYCLGIKGAGMSALAAILHDLGNTVVGYDDAVGHKFTQVGLDARGIVVHTSQDHELDDDMIVTHSVALHDDHPEVVRARAAGLVSQDYNQVMGALTKQFRTIAVSGAHGKTTTTSLIAHIIDQVCGCNYFIGDGTGHAAPGNEIFVVEADEYNKHFLAYQPECAVITNIEVDHVECYRDLDELIGCFEQFADKAQFVVACGDDENVRRMKLCAEVQYYGFGDSNRVVGKNVVTGDGGSEFDCYIDGDLYGHFHLPVAGYHMVLDALAAIAACRHFGISQSDIAEHMATYQTAKRRFKEHFFGDVVVIDDYAHHPTELRVTLKTARLKYPDKPLVAVFLPNTYSRTQALIADFAAALKLADKAYVMDIHCDRESAEDFPGVTSDALIDLVPGAEKISVGTVTKLLEHQGSVICFMSCADIYTIEDKFESLLKER